MTVYRAPTADMTFLLNHVLAMDEIAKLPGFEDATPDMVDAILTEAARFFGEVVAPTNQPADAQGTRLDGTTVLTAPVLDGIYQQMLAAGWMGLAADVDFGGQGMPGVLSIAVDEMSQSANMAFGLCPMLTKGVVTALSIYGSDEQKAFYLPRLISGEWSGTMNLTESQAGSDLAAVRTKATPNGDHYLLSGQKIFITWGDHEYTDNIIHLVLARTPDAPTGVKGISLFLVPKYQFKDDGTRGERNDVYCVGLEHKMGIHASPTCTLAFGDNGGAVGYLIGEENQGLVYMFAMMNEARLAVGLQGVAVSERAYQQAVAFAKERIQGAIPGKNGVAIIHHPDVRRMLMQMRALTEGARAMAYSALAHEDRAHKLEDQEQSRYHQRRELSKDLHPVLREAGNADLPVIAESLSASLADLKEAVEVLLASAADENWAASGAMAHNLLMLMGTCVAGAMLAKSAVAASKLQKADSGNPLFNSSKLTTANFFAEHVLPRTASYLAAVKAGSDSVMALDIDAF